VGESKLRRTGNRGQRVPNAVSDGGADFPDRGEPLRSFADGSLVGGDHLIMYSLKRAPIPEHARKDQNHDPHDEFLGCGTASYVGTVFLEQTGDPHEENLLDLGKTGDRGGLMTIHGGHGHGRLEKSLQRRARLIERGL
jgi:hypothetical protein